MLGDILGGVKSALNSVSPHLGPLTGSALGLAGADPTMASQWAGIAGALGPLAQMATGDDDDPNVNYRKRGREMGLAQKEFMDTAYPGTNPWERLGVGQGAVAGGTMERGQDQELRIAEKNMSNQRSIARMQAAATIAPSVIAQYPEMGPHILNTLTAHNTSAGPSKSLGRERLSLDNRIRTFEANLKASDVDIRSFKAGTERAAYELSRERWSFEAVVKQLEVAFKDRELAQNYARLMVDARRSVSDSVWKRIIAGVDEITEVTGTRSWLEAVRDAVNEAGKRGSRPPVAPGVTLPRSPARPIPPSRRLDHHP